ncbi:putative sodium/metabolite cotransporter bass1, chloroplastic [Turnera subulata]|uniref:Sodium/metabolite cotransporter bass1, chloroplastic n=1 Tax=Turnera subulata TaxID=218843 RepID=A0A9Q0FK44_9ROSI|nr:putative sodium/metabolite cotransporter bass1, chloroplastic [Turnera subulata]
MQSSSLPWCSNGGGGGGLTSLGFKRQAHLISSSPQFGIPSSPRNRIHLFNSCPKSLTHHHLKSGQSNPPEHLSLRPKIPPHINRKPEPSLLHCCIPPNDVHITTEDEGEGWGFWRWFQEVNEAISNLFPIWVTLGCLLGLLKPELFRWVTPILTIILLSITMLGMGMTLTLRDLSTAFAMPKELISGFVLQYSIMPISGFVVSKLLHLPPYYAAGLILVGCCPGGTASNIVTYLARGNVALSVLMTAASTLAAVIMTPFLTAKLAGQYVAVDARALLMSTLQVVLLPVLSGAILNQYFNGLVKFVSPLMPTIAVATVGLLCGTAIAQSASAILASGRQVVLASSLLHVSGFFFGYVFSRMLGLDLASSRTVSIEVGMQNSVLGVVLATQHFGNPLTAVPCAVSSVCHSVIGSLLAGYWRGSVPAKKKE